MKITQSFQQNPSLSLYIHFPWCVKKCPYCDFNSYEVSANFNQELYIDNLLLDLETDLPMIWGRPIETIFMGGGTPSLFAPKAIDRLLSGIRARLPLNPNAEITLEANPGTTEAANFEGYRAAGVNRLSLGIQSFNQQSLLELGRIHDGEQAITAFQQARAAGFKRINLDIMHGLPQQTLTTAIEDLSIATDLNPEHISWYQLTIEPNTHFYSKPPTLPDEAIQADIFQAGIEHLSANDFHRYEVSAFAKKGEASAHNMNYWSFGDYLGIGAGAHSKITDVPQQQILRRQKMRQPDTYLNPDKPFLASEAPIQLQDLPLEFMLNALRLCEGVEQQLFSINTGLSVQLLDDVINEAMLHKLMTGWPERIQPTAHGLQFLNNTLALFFSDNFPQLDSANKISIKQLQ